MTRLSRRGARPSAPVPGGWAGDVLAVAAGVAARLAARSGVQVRHGLRPGDRADLGRRAPILGMFPPRIWHAMRARRRSLAAGGTYRGTYRTRYCSVSAARRVSPLPGVPGSGRIVPPTGSRVPSKNIDSIRTWSWNHSRCRRFGVAAAAWACRCGAQCPDTCSPNDAATRGDPQPLGDAAAAGHVGLQAVDGAGRAHPPEVVQVVAVLPGGDVGGDGVADLAQAVEVVGGDGFLEPAHVRGRPRRVMTRIACLRRVAAVGVDEQLDVVADDVAGLRASGPGRGRCWSPMTRRS